MIRLASFVAGVALMGAASGIVMGDEHDRICRPGFSKTIRPSAEVTNRIKKDMMRRAGIPLSHIHEYELDHIIPLELDGAPLDPANLQLQMWVPTAHAKDRREDHARRDYCAGRATLPQARGRFHRDK